MKALLLDADGVILNKGEYFSDRYIRDYKAPKASVNEFFKGPFVICQTGAADLKEELEPYLATWGWTDGVDAFLTYWFESDFRLNEAAAAIIRMFRQAGVQCYVASNNEIYRAAYLEKRLTELDLVDGYFFSSRMLVRKQTPEFFNQVLNELSVAPEDVCFIDNDKENVDSALSVGIEAYMYRDGLLEELLAKL